jgi:uncharacterized protein YgiM (DUF1202 family)
MKYLKILTIALLLFTAAAYAEEEAKEIFPKTGYVKNDGTFIKAGDNVNFENLCALSKSDSVKVIDRRYSWLKVLLPKKACLYINKDYIYLTSDEKGIGIVNASNVNLRAGAGTRYSIVSQISKPEKVSIISEDNGWYKIEPPYGATGWVHVDQVTLTEDTQAVAPDKKTANSSVKLNAKQQPAIKGNLSITNSTKKSR